MRTQSNNNNHHHHQTGTLSPPHLVFLLISNQPLPSLSPSLWVSLLFPFSLVFKDACKRTLLVREGK